MSHTHARNFEAECDTRELSVRDIGRCVKCNSMKPIGSSGYCDECYPYDAACELHHEREQREARRQGEIL